MEVSLVVFRTHVLTRLPMTKYLGKRRRTDLDHLDGHEGIKGFLELRRDLAIIKLVHPDAVLQPCSLDPLLCKSLLLDREGQCIHLTAIRSRSLYTWSASL